jgi:phosphopantothenoylcysteine synthetase/decarboxylase
MPIVPEGKSDSLTAVEIETVGDALEILREELRGGNKQVCIHPMAVLDYLPERLNGGKIPSDKTSITIKMVRGPKIIEQIKQIAPATILVGFKLESNCSDKFLKKQAENLMGRSGAELVVANDLSRIKEGKHPALICKRTDRDVETIEVEGKKEIARVLCDQIEGLLIEKREGIPRNDRPS